MKEKDLQRIFGKHIQEHPPNKTEVYELKMCKGTSMPFNQVADHQIEALRNAEFGNLYYKINDMPFIVGNSKMRFTKPKPFDCLNICGARAYVVIVFYKLRQKKEFIHINIGRFKIERKDSDRKSLTEKRAKEISSKIVKI